MLGRLDHKLHPHPKVLQQLCQSKSEYLTHQIRADVPDTCFNWKACSQHSKLTRHCFEKNSISNLLQYQKKKKIQ